MNTIEELAELIGANLSESRSVWQASNDVNAYVWVWEDAKVFFSKLGFLTKKDFRTTNDIDIVVVNKGKSVNKTVDISEIKDAKDWELLIKSIIEEIE